MKTHTSFLDFRELKSQGATPKPGDIGSDRESQLKWA